MPEIFGSIRSEKDQVRVTVGEHLERLRAVSGHADLEALVGEPDGERVDEGLLVLDEQDVGHLLGTVDALLAWSSSASGVVLGVGSRG